MKRFTRPLITTFLLICLSMMVVGAALAVEDDASVEPPHPLLAQDDDGDGETTPAGDVMPTTDCAECHLDVTSDWDGSAHAHAFTNPNYQAALEAVDNPDECLECHVTGLVGVTGEFTAPNITCEACHGQTPAEHPPEPVALDFDSAFCGQCHTETHEEYFETQHAFEGIECFDCHNVHSGALIQEDVQQNCLTCHQDAYENYAHESHNVHSGGELLCADCHMYFDPNAPLPQNGQGERAHDFVQTTTGCLTCHEDLSEEELAASGEGSGNVTLAAASYALEVAELESELAQVKNTRSAASWLLLQGGAAGIVVGLAAAWGMRNRLHGGREEEEVK